VRVTELRFSTNSDHHAVKIHCRGVLCLDNAFALIEGHPGLVPTKRPGHPPLEWEGTREWWGGATFLSLAAEEVPSIETEE